jgi:hypothetical protein
MLLVSLILGTAAGVGNRRSDARSAGFFDAVSDWEVMVPRRVDGAESNGPVHDKTAVYELTAFNRTFFLDVHMNEHMFHPDYKEIRVSDDGSKSTISGGENCYYHGSVLNTSRSIVAISTCDGVRGMIVVNGERFQVMPAGEHFEVPVTKVGTQISRPHIIYRQSDVDVSNFVFGSATLDDEDSPSNVLNSQRNLVSRSQW